MSFSLANFHLEAAAPTAYTGLAASSIPAKTTIKIT
jgi:hypothetical protein